MDPNINSYETTGGYVPDYSHRAKDSSTKKIMVLLVVLLIFNVLTSAALLVLGGNNELSADEYFSTMQNLFEYSKETGEASLSVDNMENNPTNNENNLGKDRLVSFKIKNTADYDLINVGVVVELFDENGVAFDTYKISIGNIDAGKEQEVSTTVYTSSEDKVIEDVKVKYKLAYNKDEHEFLKYN